jgi:hypothetical protein
VNTKAAKKIDVFLKNILLSLIYRGFRELEDEEESKIFFRSVDSFLLKMKDNGKLRNLMIM